MSAEEWLVGFWVWVIGIILLGTLSLYLVSVRGKIDMSRVFLGVMFWPLTAALLAAAALVDLGRFLIAVAKKPH